MLNLCRFCLQSYSKIFIELLAKVQFWQSILLFLCTRIYPTTFLFSKRSPKVSKDQLQRPMTSKSPFFRDEPRNLLKTVGGAFFVRPPFSYSFNSNGLSEQASASRMGIGPLITSDTDTRLPEFERPVPEFLDGANRHRLSGLWESLLRRAGCFCCTRYCWFQN